MRYFFARLCEKHNLLDMLRKFSKIFKNFLRKIAKNALFYFKKLTNHALNFCAFGPKTQIAGKLRNCSKILLRELQKMNYFSIFFKKFNKPCINFSAFGRKTEILGKLWEIFRKYSTVLLRKFQKCISVTYFSNKLTKHTLNFYAFGRKTQIVGKFWENFWWNFYRKMEFLFYFLNLLLKIELSEITPFSTTIFSVSGGFPPFPRAYALALYSLLMNIFRKLDKHIDTHHRVPYKWHKFNRRYL